MGTREVVAEYMDNMFTGKFLDAFDMYAPDGTYTIIGDTPVSGVYTGPAEIREKLVPLLANTFISPPVVQCTQIIVEGDHAVALGHGEGPAKYGTYRQRNYAFAFHIQDGKVASMIEFMDPNQLSANCFGQTLSEPKLY